TLLSRSRRHPMRCRAMHPEPMRRRSICCVRPRNEPQRPGNQFCRRALPLKSLEIRAKVFLRKETIEPVSGNHKRDISGPVIFGWEPSGNFTAKPKTNDSADGLRCGTRDYSAKKWMKTTTLASLTTIRQWLPIA